MSDNSSKNIVYGLAFGQQPKGDFFEVTVEPKNHDWNEQLEEGQLSVDIFDTNQEIVLVSTLAGVQPENLEVMINNDLLTIRGLRRSPGEDFLHRGEVIEFFHSECFWGRFSRTIVLPHDVKSELTVATLQNGVLMVRLPKLQEKSTRIPITVIEE